MKSTMNLLALSRQFRFPISAEASGNKSIIVSGKKGLNNMRNLTLTIIIFLGLNGSLISQTPIDSLETLLPAKSGAEKVKVLNDLSKAYWGKSSEKTIEYGNRALELSIQVGDRNGEATALKNIGVGYSNVREDTKALEYYQKALTIYTEIDNKKGTANVLNNIGVIYVGVDEYDKALEYYLKSMRIYEEIGDTNGIATSLINTGTIYDALKNDEKALNNYKESLRLFRILGDSSGAAMCLNNMGNIYSDLKEYNKALQFYQDALEINQNLGNKFGVGNALLNIGYAYDDLENHDMALAYYMQALAIEQELGDKYGLAITLNNIGDLYRKIKIYDQSYEYLNRSLKISEEIKSKDMLKENYDCFSSLYSAKGDFKKALEYYKLYSGTKDSIFSDESSDKIADMQTKYDTEKKEKENELLRKEKEIQRATINRHKIIMLSIGLGLCLVLALAIVAVRAYLHKQKANRQLNEQKLQIEEQANKLRQANDRLIELDHFKEAMTGMIVHDLKNPLNAIINYSEDKNDLSQNIIHQAGRQMLNLVMNILDVQKFEDAQMHLETEDQNLNQIARNAIGQVEFLRHEKSLDIINNCPPNLTVRVDSNIIERVLVNLLTNAIKYSGLNGKIILETSNYSDDHIRVSIIDYGEGIPQDQLNTVFDKFRQVQPRKAGKVRSTGLGLTFCKLAVESHGGHIGVESKIGEGTTFGFTLKKSDKVSAIIEPVDKSGSPELILTDRDKEPLIPFIEQFEKLEIYEISDLRKVLKQIQFENSPELNEWQENMRRAIYTSNEEKYHRLLNI